MSDAGSSSVVPADAENAAALTETTLDSRLRGNDEISASSPRRRGPSDVRPKTLDSRLRGNDGATGWLLTGPALSIVGIFFVLPLAMSFILAFRGKDGGFTLEHFAKTF